MFAFKPSQSMNLNSDFTNTVLPTLTSLLSCVMEIVATRTGEALATGHKRNGLGFVSVVS